MREFRAKIVGKTEVPGSSGKRGLYDFEEMGGARLKGKAYEANESNAPMIGLIVTIHETDGVFVFDRGGTNESSDLRYDPESR